MAVKRPPKLEISHPGKILPVKKLPTETMMALTWYMAIDGEAWKCPKSLERTLEKQSIWEQAGLKRVKAAIKAHLPYFQKTYGKTLIGVTSIPTEILVKQIFLESEDVKRDFSSFEEYHQWYITSGPQPQHNINLPLWPVILSSVPKETLEDGWHRFHNYYRRGVTTIPAIYYPKLAKKT